MSSWVGATKSHGGGESRDCPKCGSTLAVSITLQDGHNEREEYSCPVCGEEMYARASLTPQVTVIQRREHHLGKPTS